MNDVFLLAQQESELRGEANVPVGDMTWRMVDAEWNVVASGLLTDPFIMPIPALPVGLYRLEIAVPGIAVLDCTRVEVK